MKRKILKKIENICIDLPAGFAFAVIVCSNGMWLLDNSGHNLKYRWKIIDHLEKPLPVHFQQHQINIRSDFS